ncbi:MAG: hypothetical protein ACQGVC_01735 [Myxococcota bacterium]
MTDEDFKRAVLARLDSIDGRLDGIDDRLDKQSIILSALGHHTRLMRRELIDLRVIGMEQEFALSGLTEDKPDA